MRDRPMTFTEHLAELRSRLLKSIGSLVLAFVVAWNFHEALFHFIARPVLAGLRNHLVSETRRANAAKRGAGALVSLEQEDVTSHLATLPAPGVNPETAYDRQWARLILERALARLRQEHVAQGKQALYEALAPALTGDDSTSHANLAARLGLSPGAVAVALHRLRRRLRELVRYEVLQTVGSAGDLEAEMRHLLTVWGD